LILQEPTIAVGILERREQLHGSFRGPFSVGAGNITEGEFHVRSEGGEVVLNDPNGALLARGPMLECVPSTGSVFILHDVTIGIQFHWQRNEDQTFEGNLRLLAESDGTITAVNRIPVEQYLESVISSEMSAEAPLALLEAHAITSRSWLVAMLEREQRFVGISSQRSREQEGEITRWYDREDHARFDVCADDHCQRYQGVTRIISPSVRLAVRKTRGTFLVSNGTICDARFSKSCGGISEEFQNVWEEQRMPYLTSVADWTEGRGALHSEEEADRWIRSSPSAFCNTTDGAILRQVLPSFDQETTDFFRWVVSYSQEELGNLIRVKSGMDFGEILEIAPVDRGPSGRIVRLKIRGSRRTVVVGKELEIRRWLSKSHLYSSAFVVETSGGKGGAPGRFVFRGAGWGHGVGLCQIGAAVMALRGYTAEQIVLHYFRGATLEQRYS
jgi:stage II sporulation protein D